MTWTDAKRALDMGPFPNFELTAVGEKKEDAEWFQDATFTHSAGREKHSTVIYRKDDEIFDYDVEWKVVFCPTCKRIRWKTGLIYNDELNKAYPVTFYDARQT